MMKVERGGEVTMAVKKTKKSNDVMSMYSCCMQPCGVIHVLGGVGLGLLLVAYFSLGNLMLWGWILVAIALVGHLIGKAKCC